MERRDVTRLQEVVTMDVNQTTTAASVNDSATLLSTCLDPICDSGFFGETCNQSCPANCGLDPNGLAYCDFTSGDCTYGCRDGYYGAKCTLGCSQFCKRSPANTEMACNVGKFGTFCNEDCPGGVQCRNLTCNRYTSTCIGCVVGRWGDICNRTCPNCVNGLCGQSTGFCQLGCVNGYYGDNCNYKCGDRCTVCNRVNGTCEVCNVSTFGDTCQRNCSGNCVSDPGQSFITCAKENGDCTSGVCKPGFFSPHCALTCSPTCAERGPDVQVCKIDTGDCLHGCDDGFYNPTCAHPCSNTCRNKRCVNAGNNCVDGCVAECYNFPTCDKACNSNCVNSTCDDIGGACSYGCRVGYYGNQCQLTCLLNNTCVNNTCDRTLGYCRECDLPKPGFQCREADYENAAARGVATAQEAHVSDTRRCAKGVSAAVMATTVREHAPTVLVASVIRLSVFAKAHAWTAISGKRVTPVAAIDARAVRSLLERVWFAMSELTELIVNSIAVTSASRCRQASVRSPNTAPADAFSGGTATCATGCATPRARMGGVAGRWGFVKSAARPIRHRSVELPVSIIRSCPAGLTGTFCNVSCSSNFFAENKCGRYTGTCIGCLVGRYGDQCERQCDTCLAGTKCQQVDGRCDDECMPGYYGSFCRQSCTTCITCTKSTGLCTTCTRGQYGELCQYNCSRACVPVGSIISCDIVTADCASRQCTAGYWDTDCFSFCNPNCGRSNTTGLVSCDFLTGRCSSECVSGWYGSHCDRKCESLCYDGRCDRNQGVCVECLKPNPDFNCPSGLCTEGYYGQSCQTLCSTGCVRTCDRYTAKCANCRDGLWGDTCDKNCEWALSCSADCGRCSPEAFGIDRCDINTGICNTDSWLPGYHGNRCQNTCGFTCKDSTSGVNECNRNTGICTNGCDIGYYDVYCDKNCSDRCRNRDCATTANDCRQECAYGYYGVGCLTACPSNCLAQLVHMDFSVTSRVLPDVRALVTDNPLFAPDVTMCSLICGKCSPIRCDQNTGSCSVCQNGYYAGGCNTPCLFANCDTCNKDSGQCSTCKTGFYGTRCDLSCSPNCAANINGVISCSKDLGLCDEQRCRPGYWDTTCTIQCSAACLRDSAGNRICQFSNGTCIVGCEDTYFGSECGQSCSATCVARQCGRTGVCSAQGCVTGRYGDRCEFSCLDTCNDNTCGRTSGVCDECNKLPQLQSALCRTAECGAGLTGLFCNVSCPTNCQGVCGRYTQKCTACQSGYYGNTCQSTCGNCASRICYQENGT
ncbi:multiple epidermal growth factor-like domains protein 6 [Dreissena polymorpha]|uniref:multiple epidermal growth factor-like domains protein 6 n=1 Tax=Dreissena polymorpha TaxID=45954 RepID=UPI00226466F5|nr:multiple epidermal growth factor-like domains protein 6 [Dreissena polymorpha]